MELWIRSQENGLSEIVDILPVSDEKIYGYSINQRLSLLGTYQTKERALEVLDEIEHFIATESNVYEMPEV